MVTSHRSPHGLAFSYIRNMLLISNLQILCPKFGKPTPRLNLDDVEDRNMPEGRGMLAVGWRSYEAWIVGSFIWDDKTAHSHIFL